MDKISYIERKVFHERQEKKYDMDVGRQRGLAVELHT